jgi:hypothetical protein
LASSPEKNEASQWEHYFYLLHPTKALLGDSNTPLELLSKADL